MNTSNSWRSDGVKCDLVASSVSSTSVYSTWNSWVLSNQGKRILWMAVVPAVANYEVATNMQIDSITSATAAGLETEFNTWKGANPNTVIKRTNVVWNGAGYDMFIQYLTSISSQSAALFNLYVWYDINRDFK